MKGKKIDRFLLLLKIVFLTCWFLLLTQRNKVDNNKKGGTRIVYYWCGTNHLAPDCPNKETKCNFCHLKGHFESVCSLAALQCRDPRISTGWTLDNT